MALPMVSMFESAMVCAPYRGRLARPLPAR
jgi:hypothetical protein